jgi:aryl-alcohol dehydrogenase-like predicted oxidoreductase
MIIGKALLKYKIPREGVVIMTKCRFATSEPDQPQLNVFAATVNDGRLVNRSGLSRKHIFDAVQASMRRLGTYIDVLQIQRMDRDVPREEIMRALNDVIEMGWVRYIGASSVCLKSIFNLGSRSKTTDTIWQRCPPGSSKRSRTSPKLTVGTSLFLCRITITFSIEKKSER